MLRACAELAEASSEASRLLRMTKLWGFFAPKTPLRMTSLLPDYFLKDQ